MSTNLGKYGLAKFAKLQLNYCYSVRYPKKEVESSQSENQLNH